jgi:hypothetical protein
MYRKPSAYTSVLQLIRKIFFCVLFYESCGTWLVLGMKYLRKYCTALQILLE